MSAMSTQQGHWKVPSFISRVAVEETGAPHNLHDAPLHLLLGVNIFASDGLTSIANKSNSDHNEMQCPEYDDDLVDLMLESCFQNIEGSQQKKEINLETDEALIISGSLDQTAACSVVLGESSSSAVESAPSKISEECMEEERMQEAFQGLEKQESALHATSEELLESNRSTTLISTCNTVNDQLRLAPLVGRNKERFGKRKSKRAPARAWSEEEHQRFKEALELYGRDWGACARFIGTRPAPLVRSHAQKYLIKLWKLGKPLPTKVAESGNGYTLSGKPLLPDSASARSYLTKIPCPRTSDKKRK